MSYRCKKCFASFTRIRNLTPHEASCTREIDLLEESKFIYDKMTDEQSNDLYEYIHAQRMKQKKTIKMQRKSDTPPVKNESQVNWFVKTTNVYGDRTTTGPIKAMTTSTPGYTGISQPIPAEAEAFMNSDNNAPFPAIEPAPLQTQPAQPKPRKIYTGEDLRKLLMPTKYNNYLRDPLDLQEEFRKVEIASKAGIEAISKL